MDPQQRVSLEVASEALEDAGIPAKSLSGSDTAVFWVSSNGCTSKADVKPFITRLRDSTVITLRRVDEDRCTDIKSEGVQLQWSFEELGLEPGAEVSVNNPYMMRPDDKPNPGE